MSSLTTCATTMNYYMNKRVSLVLSLSLITMLSGCATTPIPLTANQIGSNPQLETLNSIDVGGVIYEEFNYTSIEAAQLGEPFSFYGYNYDKGYLLSGYLIGDDKYFCANSHTNMNAYPNNNLYSYIQPCFGDSDFDGIFDKILSYYSAQASAESALRKSPLPYTKTKLQLFLPALRDCRYSHRETTN